MAKSKTKKNADGKAPSRFVPQVEFANFICKFGEEDLLDYAEEIVIPAFLDTSDSKENRGGTYFLMNVELRLLDDNDESSLAFVGRLVKNTQIQIAQRYDNKTQRLVMAEQIVDNAPSSLFVLILFNHVLLYVRETLEAPGTEAFGNTMETFLRRKHSRYISEQLRSADVGKRIDDLAQEFQKKDVRGPRTEARKEITQQVRSQHQKPRIEVVPLAGALATQELFDQIKTVNEINVRFVTDNGNEIGKNAAKALEVYFGDKQDLGADSFSINAHSDTGLNRDRALAVVDASLTSNTAHVRFEAVKEDGEKITGDDFRIRLKRPFNIVTQTVINLLTPFRHMYDEWKEVEKKGLVKSDVTVGDAPKVQEKLKVIRASQRPAPETAKE